MILLDRPFQVGDSIRVKGHEGRVVSVGLRSTRIQDSGGHVVSIPNDEMSRLDSKKMSLSEQSYLQRDRVLRLRLDTPPERLRSFMAFLSSVLEDHEGCDPARPPSVRMDLSDDSVVLVMISYSYHPPNAAAFAALNQKVAFQILEGMEKEGIHPA
jgi:MscS family membrane protein